MRVLALIALIAACSTGGTYVKGGRQGGDVDRGETNGRMFDFVSNMPEGDDWQIRVRDTSMWAAYGDGDKTKELGTAKLSTDETTKLWKLVDAVEIPDRKKGKKDTDEGYVTLRLREPGEAQHDIFTIFVSRADAEDDQEVVSLAGYLQKLIEKYFKKKPQF